MTRVRPDDDLGSMCCGSHRVLLREVLAPAKLGDVDAIAVSAARPAANLATAIDLAVRLDAFLLVLASRQTDAEEAAELVAAAGPALRAAVVDVPDGYSHRLLTMSVSGLRFATNPRLGDLSVKRNTAILLARMIGWRTLMFLDDDIHDIDPLDVRRAVGALGPLAMVGIDIPEFPDNSVVHHAHRLAGGRQDTFVSGAALVVDTSGPVPFFPDVYNEDWFFMAPSLAARRVGCTGTARQRPYDPFGDPARAGAEEFGDVLGEALMEAMHGVHSLSAVLEISRTPGYWHDVVSRRTMFLDLVASKIGQTDVAVASALRVALARHRVVEPGDYAAFLRAWQDDLRQWRRRLLSLEIHPSLERVLHILGLSAVPLRTAAG